MCPRCRQNAPLVYRGVSAYCTACGTPRLPLTNTSVNLAGQPSKVGGTVARAFGWTVIAGGWIFAALIAGLVALLGGGATAAVVGGIIAVIAALVGYALLWKGKALQQAGDDAQAATKNQAIFALAGTRGGVLRAWDVAQMLQVSPARSDEILTSLAKGYPDHVTVDIDDEGNILYRFPLLHWHAAQMAPNASVARSAAPPHVRVDVPPPARVATPATAAAGDTLSDADELDADERPRTRAR